MAKLCEIKFKFYFYIFVYVLYLTKQYLTDIKESKEEKIFFKKVVRYLVKLHEFTSKPYCPYRTQVGKFKDTLSRRSCRIDLQ